MNVTEFSTKLGAKILTSCNSTDKQVSGIYCGDLLSWVMSHAQKGSAWITVHTHMNIVAVATLSELSCIIVPEGIEVEEATIEKAAQEDVSIISSALSTYEICCIAHDSGV